MKDTLDLAHEFLPEGGWIHLDVADARFTYNRTWGNPEEWKALRCGYRLEAHLMAEEPEKVIDSWLDAGAERLIVHLETLSLNRPEAMEYILRECKKRNAEAFLAINPETPVERLYAFANKFSGFQTLAVHPGLAGQKFYPLVIDKIRALREKYPKMQIEADGGINAETGKRAKDAGANILVAASYVFGAMNPKGAYQELLHL
ncbi:MAG: ribulose-phosphate 3-epimerase [Candidatus Liptonbacteria bacterium]|nr:ribulose-phosphate 3-epimerase [Candidatus Liptonbacteria bacterium]